MTSSAASLTLSARNRVPGDPVAGDAASRRITSTPPPPGRCTSSRTTSGRCADTAATASSTSAASASTSTASPSSARTPRRNIAWSSTITTLTLPASLIGLLLSRTGQVQVHLGALAGRRSHVAGPAVAGHPVDNAVPHPVPVGRGGLRVEPAPPVADEDVDGGGGDLGVHVDLARARVLGGVGDGLTGGGDDRAQRLPEVAVPHADHLH